MIDRAPNLNALWCSVLAEELVRLGVTTVALAPGSRSTPLALAAAAHRGLKVHVHWDERGVGFFALGHARATGRPVAVITTSGTAVANLAPAVAEAALDHVPLLLLTADRPPELRDTSANQTMDQTTLFGSFLRWRFDVPCPSADIPLRMLLTTVDQAVARTRHGPAGPVQLNLMFREPLAPVPETYPKRKLLAPLQTWLRGNQALTRYQVASATGQVPALPEFQHTRRGVLLVGALPVKDRDSVLQLARRLRWPVLADVQSGLRLGPVDDVVVAHADLVIHSPDWLSAHRPDGVVVVGGRITSKRLAALTNHQPSVPVLRITSFLERQDPTHSVDVQWVGDVSAALTALAEQISPSDESWLAAWQQAGQRVRRTLHARMIATRRLTEPRIAWELTRRLPDHHALFAGNSLPIRLLDTFGQTGARSVEVLANRGVSGIDGLLATAVGVAAGRAQPVTLLIGDLSLLHDLNSLALLASSRVPVVTVVINNDGGGIFSFLPVAQTAASFEKVFGLPHGRRFEGAAAMFGVSYARVATVAAFIRAYQSACRKHHSALIEVTTTRAATHSAWQSLQQAVARAVTGK